MAIAHGRRHCTKSGIWSLLGLIWRHLLEVSALPCGNFGSFSIPIRLGRVNPDEAEETRPFSGVAR